MAVLGGTGTAPCAAALLSAKLQSIQSRGQMREWVRNLVDTGLVAGIVATGVSLA